MSRSFVSRGKRSTSWHLDVLGNVSNMCCTCRGRRAALWTCPSPCLVASAALQTCRVACFLRIASTGLRAVVTKCKLRGRHAIL